VQASDEKKQPETVNVEGLNLPGRNIYISYKSFPTFEKLVTSVQFGKA
jgi:hypothetical protein